MQYQIIVENLSSLHKYVLKYVPTFLCNYNLACVFICLIVRIASFAEKNSLVRSIFFFSPTKSIQQTPHFLLMISTTILELSVPFKMSEQDFLSWFFSQDRFEKKRFFLKLSKARDFLLAAIQLLPSSKKRGYSKAVDQVKNNQNRAELIRQL